jgi:hypothetical protein
VHFQPPLHPRSFRAPLRPHPHLPTKNHPAKRSQISPEAHPRCRLASLHTHFPTIQVVSSSVFGRFHVGFMSVFVVFGRFVSILVGFSPRAKITTLVPAASYQFSPPELFFPHRPRPHTTTKRTHFDPAHQKPHSLQNEPISPRPPQYKTKPFSPGPTRTSAPSLDSGQCPPYKGSWEETRLQNEANSTMACPAPTSAGTPAAEWPGIV